MGRGSESGRLKRVALLALRALGEGFDRLRGGLKRYFGWLGPVKILPYRGYGTERGVTLKGRVLERRGITRSTQHDPALRNVINMARRFLSDPVSGARVRARFGSLETEVQADRGGFFEVRFEPPEPPPGPWHPVELELSGPVVRGEESRATGRVLIPRGAAFGIISDIDDTVVKSSATNWLKMAWISLLNNAHTRLPFDGVAEFYRALGRGPDGRSSNPIFYVSSSPWNIYDLLEEFMDVHGVPAGPLLLRDWDPAEWGQHDGHKLAYIRRILTTYPELPFVLIGDSGQRDPEIYLQTVRENPGRVLAAYIRDVTTPERDAEVHSIAAAACELGVEMVLVKDTATALRHALDRGLLAPNVPAPGR
jgi:phosphatidate phosphatase APP1